MYHVCQQVLGFHYYFNGCYGRESEWGTRRSVNDVLGIMMGALFLRSIRVHLTLLGQCEW
jgi:hypothetical protein